MLVERGGGVNVPDRDILHLRRGRLLEGLEVRSGGRERRGGEAREVEGPDDGERGAVVDGGRGRRHRHEEAGAVGREGRGAARRLGELLRRAGALRVGRAGPHREAVGLAYEDGEGRMLRRHGRARGKVSATGGEIGSRVAAAR